MGHGLFSHREIRRSARARIWRYLIKHQSREEVSLSAIAPKIILARAIGNGRLSGVRIGTETAEGERTRFSCRARISFLPHLLTYPATDRTASLLPPAAAQLLCQAVKKAD